MITKIRIKLQTKDGQYITDVDVEHKTKQMTADRIIREVLNQLEFSTFGVENITTGITIELLPQ